jgi:SAM-dependent methyltransferase
MHGKDSRRTGILRLRHALEVTEARGEEMAAQAERFARLADKAAAPRVVSAFNLFQTPPDLAARMAGLFDRFGRVLEPSAGLGRLYRAVRSRSADCPVVLVDSSPECCGELYRATAGDGAARLVSGDFLTMTADRLGGLFDAVIMNPPFRMGTDVKHVRHALEVLAPGGRLVALCANGPKQRAALQPLASSWEDLPAGTFRSEGTSVAAALLTIDR